MANFIALPLPEKILVDAGKTTTFRTLRASFGDGYSQRAPDGINSRSDKWDIKWGALTPSELQIVEAALDSVGGHGILLWTPIGETVQKKFVNTKATYSRTRVNSTAYTVSVSLDEVFDIQPTPTA
jgi:phage-related protein